MRRIVGALLLLVTSLVVAPPTPIGAGATTADRIEALGRARDGGSPELAPGHRPVGIARATGTAYWVLTSDGGVQSFGGAPFLGSGSGHLRSPAAAIASTPRGDGYWIASIDGGVYSFGAAPFHGSLAGTRLAAPIVTMAVAADGDGYWLAAADGGVFAFGSAAYAGGLAGEPLAAPVVAMAASPAGGYWLAAADGGVFSFGGAAFHGSAGSLPLRSPIVGVAASPTGGGYWLAAADGGVFTYGDADFHGSATSGTEPVVALAATPAGRGYWLLRSPQPAHPPLPPGAGSGRRIVYSNPQQRVWLVETSGAVVRSYLVSGRYRTPAAGTYRVFSKSPTTSAGHDGIWMRHMVRFAHGKGLAIGFHGIPRYADGRPLQSDDELGAFRSAGCVRQSDGDAAYLYDWAPVGTTVVVLH